MMALARFGDLPSIAEVYSVPRVAAQAMTVGMRPGFSIDIGTINPQTGASGNLENETEFKYLKMRRNEEKPFRRGFRCYEQGSKPTSEQS